MSEWASLWSALFLKPIAWLHSGGFPPAWRDAEDDRANQEAAVGQLENDQAIRKVNVCHGRREIRGVLESRRGRGVWTSDADAETKLAKHLIMSSALRRNGWPVLALAVTDATRVAHRIRTFIR